MLVAPLNLQPGKFIVAPQTTRKKNSWVEREGGGATKGEERSPRECRWRWVKCGGAKRQPRLGTRRERIAGKFRGSALLELNSAPLERGKSVLLGFGIVRQPECIVRYAINWQFGLLEDSSYSGIAIVLITSVEHHSLRFNPVRVLCKDRFIKWRIHGKMVEWILEFQFLRLVNYLLIEIVIN